MTSYQKFKSTSMLSISTRCKYMEGLLSSSASCELKRKFSVNWKKRTLRSPTNQKTWLLSTGLSRLPRLTVRIFKTNRQARTNPMTCVRLTMQHCYKPRRLRATSKKKRLSANANGKNSRNARSSLTCRRKQNARQRWQHFH
jgi:hypothetical protein